MPTGSSITPAQVMLPPGWFPGSDGHASNPSGIPFFNDEILPVGAPPLPPSGLDGSGLFYSSTAVQTMIVADAGPVLQVASVQGYPVQYPFTLLLEWGTSSQEVATVTQGASYDPGTGIYQYAGVLRGQDGTVQVFHAPGAQVNHGVSARDFTWAKSRIVSIPPSGDPTGATDAAALQAALTAARTAGYGRVSGQSGSTYYLNAQIVIGSGTSLDMTDCNIILNAGSVGGMVRNYAAVNPAATAADAATTAGSGVITTSLGAVAVAGQSVVVAGAAAVAGIPFCGLVSTATPTTITVTNLDGTPLTAGASVTGASVQLYTRDKNITVRGGIWNGQANGGFSDTAKHKIAVSHIDHYEIAPQGVASTAPGFLISVTDATDGRITARNQQSTVIGADGCHVTGPVYGLTVTGVSGTVGDDMLGITASGYPGSDFTSGNVIGVSIGTISGTSTGGSLLKIIAGAGNYVDQVAVSGVINGSDANGIWVGDDVNQASTTGGVYGYIDLGKVRTTASYVILRSPAADLIAADIDCYPANAISNYMVSILGTSTVTIKTLRLSGNMNFTAGGSVYFIHHTAPSVTVQHLIMDKTNMAAPTGYSAFLLTSGGAIINQVDFVGCNLALTAAGNGIAISVSGAADNIGSVNFIGGNYNAYNFLSDLSNNPTVYTFSGGFQCSTHNPLIIGPPGAGTPVKTLVFAGCSFTVTSGQPIVTLTTDPLVLLAGPVTISAGAGALVSRAGSESVRVNGTYAQVTKSILTPAAGDTIQDTGAVWLCTNATGPVWMNMSATLAIAGGTLTGNLGLAAGTTALAPLTFQSGTNLTAAAAGVMEYDGVSAYFTNDTTSGRGQSVVEQKFRLTAAGTGITTIANFFGTTSNISLVSGAEYEIEICCLFLKTTANAVTWTFTNSAAPTSMTLDYQLSPIAGIVSTAAATDLFGSQYNITTAAATVTTGTLATGVEHRHKFWIRLINGTGTSLQIQATALTSGSITPGINSYWKARRVPLANIGHFAA